MRELRAWMRREDPPPALLAAVAEWEPTLTADPIGDADADGEHLLFRVVPGTEHDGRVVTLSYALEEGIRQITCISFRCQPYPATSVTPAWEPHNHGETRA